MSEVPHLSAQFLDPAGEDELAVRVPAADALVTIGSLSSKNNPSIYAFGDGSDKK